MTRTIAIAAVLCACAADTTSPRALYLSESGFVVTDGARPSAPGCGRLSAQWELTSYDAAAGDAHDLDAFGDIADEVESCLAGIDEPAPEAWCLWPRSEWAIERDCTTVLAVPGERACTEDAWVLPDDAGGSCDEWGKPESDCACRWTVATQDSGRTIVVPAQDPTARLAEALVRVATGCLYAWLDPRLAECSQL